MGGMRERLYQHNQIYYLMEEEEWDDDTGDDDLGG